MTSQPSRTWGSSRLDTGSVQFGSIVASQPEKSAMSSIAGQGWRASEGNLEWGAASPTAFL